MGGVPAEFVGEIALNAGEVGGRCGGVRAASGPPETGPGFLEFLFAKDNLLNSGRPFVDAFTKAALALIPAN